MGPNVDQKLIIGGPYEFQWVGKIPKSISVPIRLQETREYDV